MWNSVLVPLPADAEPHPSTPHEPEDAAHPGAGVQPTAPEHDFSPARASGWRRWLPDWTAHPSRPGRDPRS